MPPVKTLKSRPMAVRPFYHFVFLISSVLIAFARSISNRLNTRYSVLYGERSYTIYYRHWSILCTHRCCISETRSLDGWLVGFPRRSDGFPRRMRVLFLIDDSISLESDRDLIHVCCDWIFRPFHGHLVYHFKKKSDIHPYACFGARIFHLSAHCRPRSFAPLYESTDNILLFL